MKFLCDVMLGSLARWLRMLGYDTELATEDLPDDELVKRAAEEGRQILTRDKWFGKRALYVPERRVEDQLARVLNEFKLKPGFPESTRCPVCNGGLERVERPSEVPEKVQSPVYWRCSKCGKVYWQGSHWERIEKVVEALRRSG